MSMSQSAGAVSAAPDVDDPGTGVSPPDPPPTAPAALRFRDLPHLTPTTTPSQSSPPAHASAARSAAERDVKFTNADLCIVEKIE